MTFHPTAKRLGFMGRAAALAILLGAGVATAAPITYSVNQAIGNGGVTGTIRTDGHFGVLAHADILGWDLFLTGGAATFELTDVNSHFLLGKLDQPFNQTRGNGDLTADAQNLYFNFSGLDAGYMGFQVSPYSGQHYYCNATVGQGFDCVPGKSVAPISSADPTFQVQAATGNQIIASVAGGAAGVPEPATWGLMLVGFGGLGAALRVSRRRRAEAMAS